MANFKQIIIGIVALGICGFVYLFAWVIIYGNAYPFLSCYTSANPPHAEETIFFLFLAIGVLWAILVYKYPEDGLWLKITGYGSIAFVALVLVITIPQWIEREPFYEDFDAAHWQVSEGVYSGRMARRLVHDKTLIGKNKDEIAAMLGEPTHRRGFVLDVDPYLSLDIDYDSDTVKWVSLACVD